MRAKTSAVEGGGRERAAGLSPLYSEMCGDAGDRGKKKGAVRRKDVPDVYQSPQSSWLADAAGAAAATLGAAGALVMPFATDA